MRSYKSPTNNKLREVKVKYVNSWNSVKCFNQLNGLNHYFGVQSYVMSHNIPISSSLTGYFICHVASNKNFFNTVPFWRYLKVEEFRI